MDHQFVNLRFTIVERECLSVYLRRRMAHKPLVVGASEISKVLGVSRPRAYALQKQLEKKGVLVNDKGQGFFPSKDGEIILDSLQHRWKVLETFLYSDLEMKLDDASAEAMNMVLHVSDNLITTLCKRLDVPVFCPHHLRIPSH